MAYDPNNDGGTGPDEPGGPGPAGPSAPTFAQVDADFVKFLGRHLSQTEYDASYAHDTSYNSSKVANSPEGLAMANKNVPGTPGYDPSVTVAPANETGQGATPPATPGGSGGSGGGSTGTLGNLLSPFTGTFTPPTDTPYPGAPSFVPPTYTAPKPFAAPTGDEVLNDPGYAFARDQGEQALQQGHAAGGTLNTGGTLKDILAWGQNYAAQRYGDVYSRDLSTYNTNLQSQYLQPYQFAYQGALDTFNPTQSQWQTKMAATQRGNENAYANAYTSFNDSYNRWKDQRDSTFNKTLTYSTL